MKTACYTIDEKKTKRAIKRAYRKAQFKLRVKKTGEWLSNNKELTLILAPAAIGLVTIITKGGIGLVRDAIKAINIRSEKHVKDFYCYDRSLGHYWSLKRELTNREWIDIDKRKQNGERLADILNDLHVLK